MKKATRIRRQMHAPAVTTIMTQIARLEAVTGLLLRTCDDTFKRRMDPSQRRCLMAACDDVREVLGYPSAGRYLTPRERKRSGMSAFTFDGSPS